MSTHNICFSEEIRKNVDIIFCFEKGALSGAVIVKACILLRLRWSWFTLFKLCDKEHNCLSLLMWELSPPLIFHEKFEKMLSLESIWH